LEALLLWLWRVSFRGSVRAVDAVGGSMRLYLSAVDALAPWLRCKRRLEALVDGSLL
jgi:hypothetical protein